MVTTRTATDGGTMTESARAGVQAAKAAASGRTSAAFSNVPERSFVHGSATTMIVARAARMSAGARADGPVAARPGTATEMRDAVGCRAARVEAGAAPPTATPAVEC